MSTSNLTLSEMLSQGVIRSRVTYGPAQKRYYNRNQQACNDKSRDYYLLHKQSAALACKMRDWRLLR
jgi:hypothetical protein